MPRVYARRPRSRSRLDRVTLLVLVAFFIIASTTAVLAFVWVRSRIISARPGAPVVSGSKSGTGLLGGSTGNEKVPVPTGPLQRATDPTPVPWDEVSRVTILVMGLDYRDWSEGDDVPRTDSMILFSIDPRTKIAGMLSIPRDLWVPIDGMGSNKINTAYRWGEVYEVPGGGPGLAMTTVEDFLGVPVDYYALIDFNAFVQFIDELGGLDMHIKEEIVVDPIGPANTRTLEPGVQTLDGATVLAYARQRYTANDDFDRSSRQQEVIMAIRQQILQFNMLPTLVSKAPILYSQVSSGISTNLTFDQVIKLTLLAAQVDERNIKKGVIGPPLQVEFATNPDGQSILVPVPDQIRILRDEIFDSSDPVTPVAVAATDTDEPIQPTLTEELGDPVEGMKEEKARVAVKNGTNVSGLASKTGEMLREDGINVIGEENADEDYITTTIYDLSDNGNPFTIQFLMDKFNVPDSRVVYRYTPGAEADIEVILGDDWATQQE